MHIPRLRKGGNSMCLNLLAWKHLVKSVFQFANTGISCNREVPGIKTNLKIKTMAFFSKLKKQYLSRLYFFLVSQQVIIIPASTIRSSTKISSTDIDFTCFSRVREIW